MNTGSQKANENNHFASAWPIARPSVAQAKRVIIKLGTSVITDAESRLANDRVNALIATAAAARGAGREVILVSSGALGLGSEVLGYEEPPPRRDLRRCCAAVGQAQLVSLYERRFGHYGLVCGQLLVGQGDFDDRDRNLQLRSTLDTLLDRGVVPIINENDAIALEKVPSLTGTSRPVFGENDRLAALIAGCIKADLLVLMTDVSGVFDRDPNQYDDAVLIPTLPERPRGLSFTGPATSASRGGMRTKVEAACIAAEGGCQVVIGSGFDGGVLSHILAGEEIGTWIPALGNLKARKRWIAYSAASRGALHLDAGAVDALTRGRASLLAAGVTQVDGSFRSGEVIELRHPDGSVLGRGLIRFDAQTVSRWAAGEDKDRHPKPLIRRSFLVISGKDD